MLGVSRLKATLLLSVLLSACGGGSGEDGGGGKDKKKPEVGYVVTGTVSGTEAFLLVKDTLNQLQTYSDDGKEFELGPYSDGVRYQLEVDDPVGKVCSLDPSSGVITGSTTVAIVCVDNPVDSSSIELVSGFSRDGTVILEVSPDSLPSRHISGAPYSVMGRLQGTDDDFQLLGAGVIDYEYQISIENFPVGDFEVYVTEAGGADDTPQTLDVSNSHSTVFMSGVVPTYMSDYVDQFIIESVDKNGELFVKFTPRSQSKLPVNWHAQLEKQLLGTYLHGNIQAASAEVYQLTSVGASASSYSYAANNVIDELVFKAVEWAYAGIREFADQEFTYRFISINGDSTVSSYALPTAAAGLFKKGACKLEGGDSHSALPIKPSITGYNYAYDVIVKGKIKIQDGQYLPSDMYLQLNGEYTALVDWSIQAQADLSGGGISVNCTPIDITYPIRIPKFPVAKIGDVHLQAAGDFELQKAKLDGLFTATTQYSYPIDAIIGLKDGAMAVDGELGSLEKKIVGNKFEVSGYADMRNAIYGKFGFDLSPGVPGAEKLLIESNLKLGGYIAGEIEAKGFGLLNSQKIFSMEGLSVGHGVIAELSASFPAFDDIEPVVKDFKPNGFVPWVEALFPKFESVDLGQVYIEEPITLKLELTEPDSDQQVDNSKIEWRSVPEGSVVFPEYDADRLGVVAVALDNEEPLRQVVVTLPHLLDNEVLEKKVVIDFNVMKRVCPTDEVFLKAIGRAKADNNKIDVDLGSGVSSGCTMSYIEMDNEGEWVETSASFDDGALEKLERFYRSGVLSEKVEYETLVLASGVRKTVESSTYRQSEDKLETSLVSQGNVLSLDSTKVISFPEGEHSKRYHDLHEAMFYRGVQRKGTDVYDSILVGEHKTITQKGSEDQTDLTKVYSEDGIRCDDGSTVANLLSFTFLSKYEEEVADYGRFSTCSSIQSGRYVNYPQKVVREWTSKLDQDKSYKRVEYFKPILPEVPFSDRGLPLGNNYYRSEYEHVAFDAGIITDAWYRTYKLEVIPEADSAQMYGALPFNKLFTVNDSEYLTYGDFEKQIQYLRDGTYRLYENEYTAAGKDGYHYVFLTSEILDTSEPSTGLMPTVVGKYKRLVKKYYGEVLKSHEGISAAGLEFRVDSEKYINEQPQYNHTKTKSDGVVLKFKNYVSRPGMSNHYYPHGAFGVYASLGSTYLCESGRYVSGSREGSYKIDIGCEGYGNYYLTDSTTRINYRNDLRHGSYSRFKDDGGEEGGYKNGLEDGWWRYYREGVLSSKKKYEAGVVVESCEVGSEDNPC
ncbi:toxin-antitoxin system YwqK family antitoxin [Photobacterium leiognathi]|uniref:toxin-antitoxin system YwqK family antitoxin n=1 Tax=Photobacterium leiognathi TaxID=553611 RepID=UPI00298178BF|nr:hypothetical protein [Photobacterium leiognathi]